MSRTICTGVLIGTLVLLRAMSLAGQTAPTPVFSIGQPPIWRQHFALQGTVHRSSDAGDATFTYGLFHSFNKPPIQALNPLLGILGGTFEGYGSVGSRGDAGVRALLTSRMLATSVGADWDIH